MAATVERAECVDADADNGIEMLPLKEVNTPGTETIEEVAAFLGLDKKQTIKALLFVKYDENYQKDRRMSVDRRHLRMDHVASDN